MWLCPGREPISVPKTLKAEGTLQKVLRDAGIKQTRIARCQSRLRGGWRTALSLSALQLAGLNACIHYSNESVGPAPNSASSRLLSVKSATA
jgi:hypothetical protein